MSALTTTHVAFAADSADSALHELWAHAVQDTAGLPFVARDAAAAAEDLVRAASLADRIVGEHVHLANAYSVALADERDDIKEIFTDRHGWLLPDGRPLVWLSAMRRDEPRLRQVRGPQFMLDVADLGRTVGLRHFLLGGSPEVLEDLEANLVERFPGIQIVGADSPPFRTATEAELRARDEMVRASGAQVVWVGLGTPKQDVEAMRIASSLPLVAVAVGAAFDYAAGALRAAPHWVSIAGLEWLWRFAAEPRRLWKRYTVGNARFIKAVLVSEAVNRLLRRGRTTGRAVVVGQLPPPTHGSAVMTERLVEALRADGRRVAVVDRRFSRSVDEVGQPALRKIAALPSLLLRFLAAMHRSDRLILLITTSAASFLIDSLLLRLTRKPVVLYVHTVGFRRLAERGAVWRRLVRSALDRAERVVVLGPTLRDDVAPFVRPDVVRTVPNASPAPHVESHVPRRRVLFLANLLPGKGADVFVRVARHLEARRSDVVWSFDVAGAGDPSTLGALPTSLVVHGVVHGHAKETLLRDADVLLVPSTYAMEAQPLVIVEALSYGLPVIAYDTGGIRDLVDDSVGAIVKAGDEAALADAVLRILDDPALWQAVSRAARQRFEQHHSPYAYAQAWRRVLTDAEPTPGQRR